MTSGGTTTEQAPGWFGKIPMLGDFAQRRLPLSFVAACDPWLSRCVQATRLSLGDAWSDWFLTAPLWHFAWAPRVIDEHWWLGVITPSVDAVGRYFPLVIASATDHIPVTACSLKQLGHWYDYVGQCALDALQPTTTLDQLESRFFASQALLPVDDALDRQAVACPDEAGDWWTLPTGAENWPGNAGTVALAAVSPSLAGRTFWWPQRIAGERGPAVCITRGLPVPERFAESLRRVPSAS